MSSIYHNQGPIYDLTNHLASRNSLIFQILRNLYYLGHRGFIQYDDPFSWVGPFNLKSYGKFHEYLKFYIRLSAVQEKIYRLVVSFSEDTKGKDVPARHSIYHWRLVLPIIHSPLLHPPMGSQTGILIYDISIWSPLPLEGPYGHDGIIPV